MSYNLRDVYNALKADGDFKQEKSYEQFASKMNYKGYQNQIYSYLKSSGVNVGEGPDSFRKALGLQRIDVTQQKASRTQASQPKKAQASSDGMFDGKGTALMRNAADMAQNRWRKPMDNASGFVQGMNAAQANMQDAVVKAKDASKMPKVADSMKTINTLSNYGARADIAKAQKSALGVMNEDNPISITNEQYDKRASKLASDTVNSQKSFIDNIVSSTIDAAGKEATAIRNQYDKQHNKWMLGAAEMGDLNDAFITRESSKKTDESAMQKRLSQTIAQRLEGWAADPNVQKQIIEGAKHAGMSPDAYAQNYVFPTLKDRLTDELHRKNLQRYMPQGNLDYVLGGILDSTTGTLKSLFTDSKERRQTRAEALQMTNEGKNPNYKPGVWAKAGRGTVSFVADAPLYAAAGAGANAATAKVFGNGVKQAATVANSNLVSRMVYEGTRGAVHGGVTGFLYGLGNGAVQNYSTGEDTSVGATIGAALKGGLESASSFATMEAGGGIVGGLTAKVGINGLEKTVGETIRHGMAKGAVNIGKTLTEGLGMAAGGVVESYVAGDPKGFTWEGTLESCASAAIFKLMHVKDSVGKGMGDALKSGDYSEGVKKRFKSFFGDTGKSVKNDILGSFVADDVKTGANRFAFSESEKKQIREAGARSGMNPFDNILDTANYSKDKRSVEGDDGTEQMVSYYESIMNDKELPWDTKAKFTALVMGTIPQSRPMYDHLGFSHKVDEDGNAVYRMDEYSKDGTLLSTREYRTPEERDVCITNIMLDNENQKLSNAFGLAVSKASEDKGLQSEFLKSKGFDETKPLDDEKNRNLKEGMENHDSELYSEYLRFVSTNGAVAGIFDNVARENRMTRDELVAAQNKNPLRRTEQEHDACVALRKALESDSFPETKVHTEQSRQQGKDVVEENGLGTEHPNEDAVRETMATLSEAEKELQAALAENETFGKTYEQLKNRGLRNDQIYEALIRTGLTEDDLAPLAKYINANARVEGMLDGTKQKISEAAQQRTSQMAYLGTLNGEKQSKDSVVYVTTSDGRNLIVMSGDMSFDEKGRSKDGVGDMLVCWDEANEEMCYPSVKDVTFHHAVSSDDYRAHYTEQLELKNSEAYGKAAQEQEASGTEDTPQTPSAPKTETTATTRTPNVEGTPIAAEPSEPKAEGEGQPQEGATTTAPAGGTSTPSAPKTETPAGTKTFADGTPVPMKPGKKGKSVPDYSKMDAQHSAEMLTEQLTENAVPYVEEKLKTLGKQLAKAKAKKINMAQEPEDIAEQMDAKNEQIKAISDEIEKYKEVLDRLNENLEPKEEETVEEAAEENIPSEENSEEEHKEDAPIEETPKVESSNEENTEDIPQEETPSEPKEEEKTESQEHVDEAVKNISMEIAKETGLEVVTGDEAQEALTEAEGQVDDIKYQTSGEIDKKYPNWLDGTTNDNGKHSTQVAGTIGTYKKVAVWVENHLGKNVKILDASSGMGLGTKELREQGFNIEDVEPYQSEDRKKNNPATYSSYGDIKGKYDFIISNAVLNVIPDNWRSNVLHDMANRLSDGGRLFINTRKAGEEKGIKDKIELDSPQKVLVKRNGKIASYQRFFTPKELKDWVEKELGDGYEVEIANEKNSGTKGLAAVVVTKKEVSKETSPETVAPLSEDNVNASVVSRDAVAKVQTNLDVTKSRYEKMSNRTRGFITDISRALELTQHEASQYGTFVTKDEKQVTIRISNHNTRATTFDENGESEGISIVISGSRNKGIRDKENAKAHVVEFFYPKKSIERAEGKPLVSIIESVKEALETGVYKDKTGIAKPEEVNGTTLKQFRTKDGEVYGFTDGKKIYLDTKKMKPETPLHEYAHLWCAALKRGNPEEWESVKKLFDDVEELKEEVQKLYPELEGDDLYEEMITTYSGREGTKKIEQTARELAAKDGKTVTESAKARGFISKMKKALAKYWKGVADMLGIHYTSAEDVADKVLNDFAKGFDPRTVEAKKEEPQPSGKDSTEPSQPSAPQTVESAKARLDELSEKCVKLREQLDNPELNDKYRELKEAIERGDEGVDETDLEMVKEEIEAEGLKADKERRKALAEYNEAQKKAEANSEPEPDATLAKAKERTEKANERVGELKASVLDPFVHDEEVKRLVKENAEIQKEYSKLERELDEAKSQNAPEDKLAPIREKLEDLDNRKNAVNNAIEERIAGIEKEYSEALEESEKARKDYAEVQRKVGAKNLKKTHKTFGKGMGVQLGTRKAQVNPKKFYNPKDKERPVMAGVYYENGYAVATDGHRLLVTKTEYPKEYEGKTIDAKGNVVAPDGKVYPVWPAIIPRDGEELNASAFIEAVDRMVKEDKEQNLSKQYYGLFVDLGNGRYLNSDAAKAMADVARKVKDAKVSITVSKRTVGSDLSVLCIEGEGTIALSAMAFDRDSYDLTKDYGLAPKAEPKKRTTRKRSARDADPMEAMEEAAQEYREGNRVAKMPRGKQRAVEAVAKKLGADVRWVDSLPEDNGYLEVDENGKATIVVARDAENPLVAVFGHESLHRVRQLGENQYQALSDAVKDFLGEKEWNRRVIGKKKRYDSNEAEEEVVADVIGEIVNNEDMAKELAFRLNHRVLSAVKDVISSIVDAVKDFAGFGSSEEMKKLNRLKAVIDNAYMDAADVYADKVSAPSATRIGTLLSHNVSGYDAVAVPWGKGDLIGNNNAPTRYSTRAAIEGAGLIPNTDDGGRVTFSLGDKVFDKEHPVTIDDLKSTTSPLMELVKACEEAGTLTDTDTVLGKYCDVLNLFLKKGDKGFDHLSDEFAWSGEALFKTVSNNSDAQYKKSVDITRLCKKNEAVIYAICELQKRQGYGATPGQILDIYESTNKQGYQVPCPVCYVFSRYVANGQYATALVSGQRLFGKYLKDPNTMTPKQREKYVADWCARLGEVKAWKTKNSKIIAQAKSDIITILQQVDAISEDITSGKLKGDALTLAKQHIRALDKLYRDALNITAKASLDGWIANIALEKKGGKKVDESAENSEADENISIDPRDYVAREDSWKAYPEDMALDLRKTAEAEREYPGIVRFRRSRGAAAGKYIQFAADNKVGELVELLGKTDIENNSKNYSALQKAFVETDDVTRAKYMNEAQENIRKAVVYAARQSLRGGIRQWSWSDNIERLMPDVFLNILQEHMVGAAIQAYSKQLEGIEMVAAMNGYINGSLMGKGIGVREVAADYKDAPVHYNPADGKYYTLEFDNVVGVEPFSRDGKLGLFDLNKMYDRAGNILVGMSNTHVRTALADPRIFFVIPWHASGANNHVLMQMYKFLGIDTTDLKRDATDYTKTQEDKRFSENGQTDMVDREVWEENNYGDKYKCGIGTIESGTVDTVNGEEVVRLSEGQKHYRALRDAILTTNMREPITSLTSAQRKALETEWENGSKVTEGERIAELEAERKQRLNEIEGDEFLSQVLRKQEKLYAMGETMEAEDCKHIYPYEYWDEKSTYGNADVNGERYLEYCRRMGFRPKFCGITDHKRSDTGNFVNDKGYWKLLIDRRMYKRNGDFQDLTPVTVDRFSTDLIDRDVIEKRVPVTRVANGDETNGIVDQVQETERQRGLNSKQFVPNVNYDLSFDKAAERYQKTTDREAILSGARKYVEQRNMKKAEARAKAKADLEASKLRAIARANKKKNKEGTEEEKDVKHSYREGRDAETKMMELGKTFSNTKEDFDGVRDRAIAEKGIVMPNLNKDSVKVVPVEKHQFGAEKNEGSIESARKWAETNLVTTNKPELPQMRDGTPYSISKKAVGKYLSETAVGKSSELGVHLSVLPKLTEVIHESLEAEIHPDYNKDENGNRNVENGYGENVLVHRMYGAVSFEGKTYRVKTTMQEFRGKEENKPHSYEVTEIDLLDTPETAVLPDSSPLDITPSKSISAAKLLNGVEKSYDPGKKLLDESKNLEDGETHFRPESTDSTSTHHTDTAVSEHVSKVAEKLGGTVVQVHSAEQITDPHVREAIRNGKRVTGWYNEKTGNVCLYMPNIHDRYTAEKTIWHEMVGHKGMRGLLGDKFKGYLRSLWNDLDNPINKELREYVRDRMAKDPMSMNDAIEEFIADYAERGKGEPGFWNNIRNKITDALHEIGYRVSPNTKDVKYMLWLAKNAQKHPNDPVWKMRAESVRYKIYHDETPMYDFRNGIMCSNDAKNHSLDTMSKADWEEATDGKIHFRTAPSAATALDRYNDALNAHGYMFTESYMDNMLSLKELMTAIRPDVKKIEDIDAFENPYVLQNTMQGAMANAGSMFERNVMKPLDEAMAKNLDCFEGKTDEERIQDFNLYMIKKHGLERNRVFFVRDKVSKIAKKDRTAADQMYKDFMSEKKRLSSHLHNGRITLEKFYERLDDYIRNNVDKKFNPEEHDYSGFHGMYEIADTDPYDDAQVIEEVMDRESNMEGWSKGSVRDLWSKIHAATSFGLWTDYKNGFASRESYTRTSQMFDWYVPLRKFDETTAEDVYGYINGNVDGESSIGKAIIFAKGRTSLSETNVLAQIGAMGNSAIKRGGNNAVKQAFMRFVRNNPGNGLVTESKVWAVQNGTDAQGNAIWKEVFPDIKETDTPKMVSNKILQFEKDMEAKKKQGLAMEVVNKLDAGFRFEREPNKSQHAVDVMVNGRTVRLYINGNPRAAQALNGLLENSSAEGATKVMGDVTRIMAQMCTSYNPEFVMRNIMRDAEFASANVAAKEGARYAGLWAKYYGEMIGVGMGNIKVKDFKGSEGLGLYAKYRNGTLDLTKKTHKYFKEFMENGGETGWVQIKTFDDWNKAYRQDVKTRRSKFLNNAHAVTEFLFGNLENINEAAENMARFATFCASRESGRSAVRSAYDAKEVSTNFNRHGSGDAISSFQNGKMSKGKRIRRGVYSFTSSYLRHTSMFFNAGIQSTNLLLKNAKRNPVTTGLEMMAMPAALGAISALVNNFLINQEDEKERGGVKDPYGELPEYVRRTNLCVYTGKGHFITIPLAIELRAFYGLGDLAIGTTPLASNIRTERPAFMDAVGAVSQLVPVMDYANSHAVDKDPFNETLKAFAPSAVSPIVEWCLNSDWKGAPIRREKTQYNENAPAWQRAYSGTPDMFMELNKKVNAATNDVAPGNENMLGNRFLDTITDPAMLNHYLDGIGGGLSTFVTRTVGLAKNGWEKTETKDIPFVRSLVYTPSEQSSMQRTKTKWYNYVEEMAKNTSNYDRLKSKNVPLDERIRNIAAMQRFEKSQDYMKIDIIKQAEKQTQRWKKIRDRSSDTEVIKNANANIDNIMQTAVEQLDKLN